MPLPSFGTSNTVGVKKRRGFRKVHSQKLRKSHTNARVKTIKLPALLYQSEARNMPYGAPVHPAKLPLEESKNESHNAPCSAELPSAKPCSNCFLRKRTKSKTYELSIRPTITQIHHDLPSPLGMNSLPWTTPESKQALRLELTNRHCADSVVVSTAESTPDTASSPLLSRHGFNFPTEAHILCKQRRMTLPIFSGIDTPVSTKLELIKNNQKQVATEIKLQIEPHKDKSWVSQLSELVSTANLRHSFRKLRGTPSIASIVKIRLILLTVYFLLQYTLLPCWQSNAFTSPPPSPSSTELASEFAQNAEKLLSIEKFIALVHPHIDSPKQLNTSLFQYIKRGLGFLLIEWIFFILLASKLVPDQIAKYAYGVYGFCTLGMQLTGVICGGLVSKTILFPDIWNFVSQQIHYNLLGKTRQQYIALTIYLNRNHSSFGHLRSMLTRFLQLDLFFYHCRNLIYNGTKTSYFVTNPLQYIQNFTQALSMISLYILDFMGAIFTVISTLYCVKLRHIVIPLVLFHAILALSHYHLHDLPSPDASDHHFMDFRPYLGKSMAYPGNITVTTLNHRVKPHQPVYLTKYILMHDSTELAADIYLPPQLVYNYVTSSFDSPAYMAHYLDKLGIEFDSDDFELIQRCRQNHSDASTLKQTTFKLGTTSALENKIPTLLIVTRYNRRMTLRWPFTLLSIWGQSPGLSTTNIWTWQFVDALVANNYAVVVVDARGTGASFGNRPIDFAPDEIEDLNSLHSWITNQFWYDGTLAVGGFSYDGITGLQLASLRNVQAVLALFTPINVVNDLIQPGGIVCSSFVEDYTKLTTSFEKGGSPGAYMLRDRAYDWQLIAGFALTFGIAAPIKFREADLPLAIQSHQSNWNMSHMVEKVHFADDFVVVGSQNGEKDSTRIPVYKFGITKTMVQAIGKSEAAVYIVGGYCDSSSVRGSVRLFDGLEIHSRNEYSSSSPNSHAKHELILGPWTHTGRRNCSPYSQGTYPHFEVEMYWDIIRFLDCHLRHDCWSLSPDMSPKTSVSRTKLSELSLHSKKLQLNRDALSSRIPAASPREEEERHRVHFWSVGEERWISSKMFPPSDVKELDLMMSNRRISYPNNSRSEVVRTHQKSSASLWTYGIVLRIMKDAWEYCAQRVISRLGSNRGGVTSASHQASSATRFTVEKYRPGEAKQHVQNFSFSPVWHRRLWNKILCSYISHVILDCSSHVDRGRPETDLISSLPLPKERPDSLQSPQSYMRDSYYLASRTPRFQSVYFDEEFSQHLFVDQQTGDLTASPVDIIPAPSPPFKSGSGTDSDLHSGQSVIRYKVDYTASTQGLSRWLIAKHPFRMSVASKRDFFSAWGPIDLRDLFLSENSLTTNRDYAEQSNVPSEDAAIAVDANSPEKTADNMERQNAKDRISEDMNAKQVIELRANQDGEMNPTDAQTASSFLSHALQMAQRLMTLPTKKLPPTGRPLLFSSLPLSRPLRVVGSPLLRLSINMTAEFEEYAEKLHKKFNTQPNMRVNEFVPIPAFDITLFAYLEDVDLTTHTVHYVTEGRILLSHRPTLAMVPVHEQLQDSGQSLPTDKLHSKIGLSGLTDWDGCVVQPNFHFYSQQNQNAMSQRQTDDSSLSSILIQEPKLGSADRAYQTGERSAHHFTFGGVECLIFTFEPIAWYFRPGHIIRLSLVGSDRANFQWSQTQIKEDADLFQRSLVSTVRLNHEFQQNDVDPTKHDIHVQQPVTWEIPLNQKKHQAFLKLPIFTEEPTTF